jgi:transmembrane sensor
MKNSSFYNQQITQEASGWVVLIDERPLTSQERGEFASWIRLSPVHIREFLLVHSILSSVEDSQCALPDDISKLAQDVVVEAADYRRKTRFFDTSVNTLTNRFRHPGFSLGTAASIVALLFVLLSSSLHRTASVSEQIVLTPAVVSTQIGEVEVLRLSDGSVIHLNTDTRLEYLVNESVRRVELIEGEAFFEVAADPTRPFIILANNTIVHVVGTAFNIRSLSGKTSIEVSEGIVTASIISIAKAANNHWMLDKTVDLPTSISSQYLKQGEKAVTDTRNMKFSVSEFDYKLAAAWRSNKLIFDNKSIAEIITEYNRYNDVQLKIIEPELLERRLSGVFDARDPESFVAYLRLTSNISVVRKSSEIRVETMMQRSIQ